MHEFYYQNRKWSHFEGIYRLWSYQSHLQLGGNQIHLHFCKNYWFSESEMIQVPIHVIPKLKYDHALLLFETLSTVSKKEILIFFFYVNHFLMAPSSMQDPEPWALPGCGQVWYSSVPGDHHRESLLDSIPCWKWVTLQSETWKSFGQLKTRKAYYSINR